MSIINEKNFLAELQNTLNKEMIEAAQPIIHKALAQVEKAMQERLGAMLIGMIRESLIINTVGQNIQIEIKKPRIS